MARLAVWMLASVVLARSAALAQESAATKPLTRETILLARIKVVASENLERLPNYTCLETIERSQRRSGGRRFELVDVLRLEVGFVDRKEVFAWPGSGKFEDKDISDLVPGGAIGNGSFALHVRGVFLSGQATFTYLGKQERDGRAIERFAYRVPMFRSGYRLRVRPLEGVVGYQGSIEVDAQSLDLVRLEVIADEIPPHLPVRSARETLEYARMPIGDDRFLLPLHSELILEDLQGNESRNRLRFTDCRQFAGESVIRFAGAEELDAAPSLETAETKRPESPRRVSLPAQLDLDLRLSQAIDSKASAVGDVVQATVTHDARRKGVLYVPKGARVTGRLVKLERRSVARGIVWIAGLRFQQIEWENCYGDLRVEMVSGPPLLESTVAGMRSYTIVPERPPDAQTGILYIRGEAGKIPAGTRTLWRTLAPDEERK